MKNKKILIVSHQFLPHISPRTTRWKLLIDELIASGNEVTILTGTNPELFTKKYNILYFGNKNISSAINSVRNESNKVENTFLKKFIFSLLKKIYRVIFKTLAWPDYAMFWIFTIIRNKEIVPKDFDIIVSVSLPFTSHVGASILYNSMSADWVMDIGDPFSLKKNSFENNKFLFSFINAFYERKYYEKADKIIFTHSDAAELHKKKFNIDSSKVVIGHPISIVDHNYIKSSNEFNYKNLPVNIGYFGIFTDGVRDPSNYLDNIANSLEDVFHHYWYTNEESVKYFSSVKDINKHIFKTMIPREEAVHQMINNFHILLSIGNKNRYQLPSKIIEYIALGKPVLHYAEISSDPMYRFESLFENFKIIDMNTSVSEVENFLNIFQVKNIEFNYKEFENYFSPQRIIEDLN